MHSSEEEDSVEQASSRAVLDLQKNNRQHCCQDGKPGIAAPYSDDSSVELEVLPPKLGPTGKASRRSRLSYSGMDQDDPVTLLHSDDEYEDPKLLAPKRGIKTSCLTERHCRKSASQSSMKNPNSQFEDDDDDVIVLGSPPKRAKQSNARAESPRMNRPSASIDMAMYTSESESDGLCSKLTNSASDVILSQLTADASVDLSRKNTKKRAQLSQTKSTAGPKSYWDDSDSDSTQSDNSLKAITNKYAAAKRKPPPQSQQSQTTSAGEIKTTKNAKAAEKSERAKLKEAEKIQKQQERQRLRQEKEDRKAAAELRKEQAREAKIVEKRAKEQHRVECAQASGKLAKDEIAVLLQHDHFPPEKYTVLADLQAKYMVQEHPSALQCNAVQWIRADSAAGGAAAAVEHLHSSGSKETTGRECPAGYHHFPVVAIVVSDAAAFLKLLERPGRSDGSSGGDFDDDDYPALEQWIKGVECGWRAAWSKPSINGRTGEAKPRIVLLLDRVLEALDKLWIQHRKAASRNAKVPPTAEDLHDAITWILIQFQVECVHCTCADDISIHLQKITRLLADTPYRRVVTELECVQKLRPECFETDPPSVHAKDCWMRQLQQLPLLSRRMAEHLVHYYPNAQSLHQAYTNPRLSMDEKLMLTANLMAPRKSHAKLSSQLYTVLTSNDPNELLR
jgi:hypothetical protein